MHILYKTYISFLFKLSFDFLRVHDNLFRTIFDNTFAGIISARIREYTLVYSPVVAEPLLRKATTVHDRASRLLRLNAHVAITGNAVTGSDFTLRSIDFAELDFRFGFPLRVPSTDRRIDMLSEETTRSRTINWPILFVQWQKSCGSCDNCREK